MEQKQFIISTKGASIDTDKRIITGVIGSTGALDRHGETVNPDGWKIDNYMDNPVLLFAHDYRSLPVGKAIKVWVENKKLMFTLQFASTEFAKEVFQLFVEGVLSAFSVGFMVLKWGESGGKYSIDEQELLELSVVPVPANPEALAKMHIKGMEQDELVLKLKALYEHLEVELKAQEETSDDEEETDEPVEDDAGDDEATDNDESDEDDDTSGDDDGEQKEKVVVIKASELKSILAETLKEVITDYKVVEEKIIEKLAEKSDEEETARREEQEKLLETVTTIRSLVVKSDSYSGTALSKMKKLLTIISQQREGGEK